jgi:hypothetical protein
MVAEVLETKARGWRAIPRAVRDSRAPFSLFVRLRYDAVTFNATSEHRRSQDRP